MRLTAARGLVTSSNELTRPDGALVVADNINIDYDHTIQPRKGFSEYSQLLATPPKQIFTYKSQVLTHYGTNISFDLSNTGTFTNLSGSFSELISGLRLKGLEASGNFYFTTSDGVKKISVKNASDLSSSTEIKQAGAVEAFDLSAKPISDPAGFLPGQSKVAYRLLFGYKDANNNLQRGTPSSRVIVSNQSADVEYSEIFTANVVDYTTIVDGDYFLFNTADSGYFVWFKKTGTGVAPITADTVDRTGIEVDIQSSASNSAVAAAIANAVSSQVSQVSVVVSLTEVEITVNSTGNVTDPAQGSLAAGEILITKVFDGSITTATPAKAQLTFTLPTEANTSYFYQIYRTAVTTLSAGLTFSDLDPGDEMYYVFEAPITAADVTAGEITIEDNTPEAFRQVGAYLYTNATTGEGITQANSRPPIAQDIALFRNSTFYGNTKDYHTLTFSMLSVDDFVSGSTKFIIGRGGSASEYTFVGVKEVTDITVAARSATTESSYITLNSANDERQYYIWFDCGAGVDPALSGKIGIRVTLSLYDDTAAGSKEALIDALALNSDFSVVDQSASVVRITCTDSGQVTAPTLSAPVPGWTFSVVTAGDGEDSVAKEVLLSLSDSVSISIDSTARSLIKVINKDPDSPVTATYLSGVDDLPGKILLKAKTLTDIDFYIAISDAALSVEFSPEIPARIVLDSIDSTTDTFTTTAAHGFVVGDEVYVNDNPGGTITEFGGAYTIATVPTSTTFTLSGVNVSTNQPGPLSAYVYKTTAASDNNETPNRVYYSKISQPEAVPAVNYIDVGSKDKQILRILGLRDNLFVLKEDGIFIVTGASAPNFSVRLLDNSAILIAPDTAVVLNNLIYCLTTQGVVAISDSGVSIVGRQIEDQIKKVTTFNYNYRYTSFGVSYESDRAYLLWLPTNKTDTVATQCFRYSTITNTWTRWTMSNTCGGVNQLGDDRMYLGGATRNYVLQERKNNERQDHCDRNFTRSIPATGVTGDQVTISSTTDVEVGDVIVQQLYLTITKFNNLLKKLDLDVGPADTDYYTSLSVSQGVNLANSLIALAAKLNADANLGTFTTPTGTNTVTALRDEFNILINELNGVTSGTVFKDYRLLESLLTFETEILTVTKGSNVVTVDRSVPFTENDIVIYKAIKTEVEWAPQHFGEPEKFKQIKEGTIIFDQCTVSNAIIGYASDRSISFVDIPFQLDGTGAWGSYEWIDVPWGGDSNERSQRTLIPQNKARCRYLHVRFKHAVARQEYKLLGISLEPREFSTRAYR